MIASIQDIQEEPAFHEILVVDERIRELITQRASVAALRKRQQRPAIKTCVSTASKK